MTHTKAEKTNNTIQAAWVALGSLFSVGFAIVSAMILSRYLSKADYGLYKQVIYVYSTLNGLFMLGLPKAFSYFLPKSPIDEAKSLINKLTNLFYILGGSLSILLFLGSNIISDILNAPNLGVLLRIFSPVPLLMMPTMGLEGILATYRETKLISVYIISTRLSMILCICLPIVLLDLGVRAALLGFVASSFISFVIALYLRHYPIKNAGNKPTKETYKSIFQFCFPLFIASIWGIIINSTDQFFISRYFGNDVFADFSNGAMELPFVGVIIGATSTVLTPLFTRQLHKNVDIATTILPVWKNAFSKSAMLIYPLAIFCIFDAEIIMVTLYGEQYVASADFFIIKIFTYFFKVIVFYSMIVALGATKFYQRVFLYFCVILIATEYLAIKIYPDPLLITAIHVFYTILSCIVMMVFIAKKLGVSVVSMIPTRKIAIVTILSILSCLITYGFRFLIYSEFNILTKLCIDISIYSAVFIGLSIIFKLDYLGIVKPILFKQ